MNTFVIDKIEDIQKLIEKNNKFAGSIGSNLLSHRLQAPLVWWKNFSSNNNVDFATKRGRNCLGYKSWIKKILYITTEKDGDLCGAVLLFISSVLLKGRKEPIKVLSFCPDSVMMFYQDLLVQPNLKQEAIESLFERIESIVKEERLLLFIGHIPENSPNIPYLRNEILLRQNRGWIGGETTNCSRGGVYPWNISRLCTILQSVLNEIPRNSTLRANIKDTYQLIEKQTTALLVFAKTRRFLENKVEYIANELKTDSKLAKYSQKLIDVLTSSPIMYPYLKLPDNVDAFYSSLTSSKRYYYRRYLKKYLSSGGSFENLSPEDITAADIEDYLLLHKERWQKESAAINDKTISFHKELCSAMSMSNNFRLLFAKYNGKRIAALSCFDINGRREFYYSGRSKYDTKLRAGKLVVLYSILEAIERGLKIYDFGYGGDEYKSDFTDQYVTLKSFLLIKDQAMPDLKNLFPMYEQIELGD